MKLEEDVKYVLQLGSILAAMALLFVLILLAEAQL